jgi:hypothetical protein
MERAFDPEVLRLLQDVLEAAAAIIPPETRTLERKTRLAARILTLAANGETDPVRLRTALLLDIARHAGDTSPTAAAE